MNKIKLLFIHHTLTCGGAEQALFDLVTLLDQTKFDITVLVQIDGGVWEKKFKEQGIRVRSIWDGQRIGKSPWIKLHNLRKRNRIKRGLRKDGIGLMDAIWENEEFDIIVSYGVWSMHSIGFYKHAKTIKYIHGDVATNPGYRENIQECLPLMTRYNGIICVSEAAKRSFDAMTGDNFNSCMHFNPLNDETIKRLSDEKVSLNVAGMTMCAVGRLAQEKGFQRLLSIHRRMLDRGIPHHLIIVGDGPEKESLQKMIKELQLEHSIHMVGYQSNPYPYIKMSDFLVCSSYTEGLPVVAMEALCLGVPVISAVPSIGELFNGEFCGLVTENDDESLENGLYSVLSDPQKLEQLKMGAKKRSAFFQGKRMVKEIEEEFINILKTN